MLTTQSGAYTLEVYSIRINDDDIEKTNSVGVTNTFNGPASLVAQLKGVDDTNGILAPTKDLDNKLQDIIKIDKPEFVLQAGETTNINITVKNSPELRPGGTYAALVIKQSNSASNSAVGFQSAIGTGIFITKEHGAVRKLSLSSFSIHRILLGEPDKLTVNFKNDGNVQTVPRGVASTTNQKQTIIYQKGVVNQESISLMPGKSVNLEVPLNMVKRAYLPSRQKVVVQYRYDGSDYITTSTKELLYIPRYLYFVVLLLVIGLFLLLKNHKKLIRKKKIIKTTRQSNNSKNSIRKKIVVEDQNDGEKIPVRKG